MALKVYNTRSNKKEVFEALVSGKVGMYVCGPTVYDFLHVGNFRGPIFFNLVRNWLEESGYEVTYVYNYTDVDDKIIKRANEEGVEASQISQRYIMEFEKDFNALKLTKHNYNPKVTEFIEPIITMIEKIIENGFAYVVEGEVFYDIEAFETYGGLSGKKLDELNAGHRVDVDSRKKKALDFSLWKPAKPGEPSWDSPWGKGRPGWHIECSAMSASILGEQIDIHGGGVDLIFPHHENEVAQSEACTGKKFVKYWMHNNYINVGGDKMSKSLGNIFTAREFLTKFNPEIFKFMILASHYRTLSDFGERQIEQAINGLARVYSALALADYIIARGSGIEEVNVDKEFTTFLEEQKKKIHQALDDDFNTPEVFARIFEAVRKFNSSYTRGQKLKAPVLAKAKAFKNFVQSECTRMSLFTEDAASFLNILDDMLLEHKGLERSKVDSLVAQRKVAREAKDFAKSDEIRDQLLEMGIAILDTPEGSIWEVQK